MKTHPSKDITETRGSQLKGRKVALCVTGSVAAVQSPDIARELMRRGAEVYAVMSPMAQKIIHPNLVEWATGNPVLTELTGKIEYISMTQTGSMKVDLVLIAPATANTVGKLASGVNDTAVTAVAYAALGSGIPVMVAPAMHESMYNHPVTAENIKKLQAFGFEFLSPKVEEQKAKLPDASCIADAVIRKLTGSSMQGLRLLVTAGPTYEYIDPIRLITNRSSGKMGISVVMEALRRGADTTLVYGPGTAKPPAGCRVLSVETTEQMLEAVISELKANKYDVFIATAAVADFKPEKVYSHKIPTKENSELTLRLKPTRKIIEDAKKLSPETFLVAFKAEYGLSDDELVDSSFRWLNTVGVDLVVANDAGRENVGFGSDTNEVFIVDRDKKVVKVPLARKEDVASRILDVVVEKLSRT